MSGIQPQECLPQTDKLYTSLRDRNQQVQNSARGYVFELDDMKRLHRFIIMGSEGGSYHMEERELKRENISCIDRLIGMGKGVEAVQTIKEVSVNRRNVEQDPLLLAYAICARCNDSATKSAAYAILSEVCRTPTHLFLFLKFCEQASCCENTGSCEVWKNSTGWGRAHKKAVGNWYKRFIHNPYKLAKLVHKFKKRKGWSHQDALRLAHPSTDDKAVGFILRYITNGMDKARDMYLNNCPEMDQATAEKVSKVAALIQVYETAVITTNEEHLCSLIREYHLTWEQCNSDLLKSKKVWVALLPHMPIEATIRNLGKMTSIGLFADNSEDEQLVITKIQCINSVADTNTDQEENNSGMDIENAAAAGAANNRRPLRRNRRHTLHPFKILMALITYKTGHGDAGGLSWTPNRKIMEALDQAFYKAFEVVEPTGKKFYLAVDVSGSMSQPVLGSTQIHCATAAAAMTMLTAKTEEECIIKGFSHTLVDIPVARTDTIEIVQRSMDAIPIGVTDCAKPMLDAIENKIKDIDVFVVYTASQTWAGKCHPVEALHNYRTCSERPNAKLVVCGMCSTGFTIAEQDDPNMLDVPGFDPAVPRLISEFAVGNI